MLLDKFDQTLLAELAEFVFRLSDAIAISDEDIARLHAHGALLISHPVEQADDRARSLHPRDTAVAAQQQRGKMSSIAVGQLVRFAIITTQEHSRVLLDGSTAIELIIQGGHQQSGRKSRVAISILRKAALDDSISNR